MLLLAILIAAECALLVALIVLRDPKYLLLAVVVGLPFEVLQTQALSTLGQGGIYGAIRTLLNPGRAAILATIGMAMVRARFDPRRLFPDSMVLLPITALLAFLCLGVVWSDSLHPANEILILPMYIAFVFTAPSLIEDRKDLERILGAFLIVAAGLSVLAIAQRLTGIFQWRQILIQSDNYSYRSNATFADPNHLARYLAISMSLAVGLILSTGPRRLTVYLAIPSLVISAGGIVMTASRSGWLSLMFCTSVVILTAPIAHYTKLRLFSLAGAALLGGLTLLLLQGGADAQRIKTLASANELLGQREFLIRAGWQMFVENPFIGVGSGNYQHALLVTYRYLIPDWATTTLSHTSLITVLSESGVVGLAAMIFVGFRIGIALAKTYRAAFVAQTRLVVGWLAASMMGILLQSQSEGRLLDDPYLWVLLAIFVAVETRIVLQPGGSAAEPAAVVSSQAPVLASVASRALDEQGSTMA